MVIVVQGTRCSRRLHILIEKDKGEWEKIGAQLCNLSWKSIDSKLMLLFRPDHLLVWEKACGLNTNYLSCDFLVVHPLKRKFWIMSIFLGKVQASCR